MKKLFLAIIASCLFTVANYAQTPQKKEAAKTQATHTKKDGTPDKRYKENKDADKTQHLKKDGTPDKRYKENKKAKPSAA